MLVTSIRYYSNLRFVYYNHNPWSKQTEMFLSAKHNALEINLISIQLLAVKLSPYQMLTVKFGNIF